MPNPSDLPPATRRWLERCEGFDPSADIRVFPAGTKTAVEAARAMGCRPSEIVKSLVFEVDGEAVLALVPGDRNLQPARLAEAARGRKADRASLDRVKEATGFAAGGTPPSVMPARSGSSPTRPSVAHDPVWAAAGAPTTVFPISLAELDRIAHPRWCDLS